MPGLFGLIVFLALMVVGHFVYKLFGLSYFDEDEDASKDR